VKGCRTPWGLWAECRNGILYVADQTNGPFGRYSFLNKNYHGADYPLFHMDIRVNAEARVAAYMSRGQSAHAASP
jgi:hypothetical protein